MVASVAEAEAMAFDVTLARLTEVAVALDPTMILPIDRTRLARVATALLTVRLKVSDVLTVASEADDDATGFPV